MSNEQVQIGVGVIVITSNGAVLLQRQGSHGAGEWSFPGGHLEFGESIIDCAMRECEEEIGVKLSSCQHLYFYTEDSFPGKQYITIYVIGHTKDTAKICEPHKASAIIFINNTDAIPEPAFSGVKKAWEIYKSNSLPFKDDGQQNRQS